MNAQPIPVPEKKNPDIPTITVKLDDSYHDFVLKAAKEDDRPPSKWLKRFIQNAIDKERQKPA